MLGIAGAGLALAPALIAAKAAIGAVVAKLVALSATIIPAKFATAGFVASVGALTAGLGLLAVAASALVIVGVVNWMSRSREESKRLKDGIDAVATSFSGAEEFADGFNQKMLALDETMLKLGASTVDTTGKLKEFSDATLLNDASRAIGDGAPQALQKARDHLSRNVGNLSLENELESLSSKERKVLEKYFQETYGDEGQNALMRAGKNLFSDLFGDKDDIKKQVGESSKLSRIVSRIESAGLDGMEMKRLGQSITAWSEGEREAMEALSADIDQRFATNSEFLKNLESLMGERYVTDIQEQINKAASTEIKQDILLNVKADTERLEIDMAIDMSGLENLARGKDLLEEMTEDMYRLIEGLPVQEWEKQMAAQRLGWDYQFRGVDSMLKDIITAGVAAGRTLDEMPFIDTEAEIEFRAKAVGEHAINAANALDETTDALNDMRKASTAAALTFLGTIGPSDKYISGLTDAASYQVELGYEWIKTQARMKYETFPWEAYDVWWEKMGEDAEESGRSGGRSYGSGVAEGLKESFRDLNDITSGMLFEAFKVDKGQDLLSDVNTYRDRMSALTNRGFPASLIHEVMGMGLREGSAAARELLSLPDQALGDLRSTLASIQSSSRSIGLRKEFYPGGVGQVNEQHIQAGAIQIFVDGGGLSPQEIAEKTAKAIQQGLLNGSVDGPSTGYVPSGYV